MASITNTLMNVLKKSSSFSIVDTNGNALVAELKIKSVSITEDAISSRQPINLTQSQLKKGYKQDLYEDQFDGNEATVTVHSRTFNTDTDILYTKVINPASVRISCLSSNVVTNLQLIKLFKDCETLYTVTSRTVKLKNMTITGLEFEIDPEHLNVYPVQIDFKEVFSPDKTYSPLKDGDQDSVGLTVTLHSVKDKVEDIAKKIYNDVI